MKKENPHKAITIEALLRYTAGDSSLAEIAAIEKAAVSDSELRESLELLEDINSDGLLQEPASIPMENMAAAADGNLCDILCEQYLLKEYYPEERASDTLGLALDNSWVKESGTPLHNAGRLLEKHGWPVSRSYNRTLEDIADELAKMHHAIVVVDSGLLWNGRANGLLHAVVVQSVEGGFVRIWDPALETNTTYASEEFEIAWKESRSYLVIASSEGMEYIPRPADVSNVKLDPDLIELGEAIAENVHDVWARQRMEEGWKYGDHRDDSLKLNPDLVPYSQLPENEKNYDRFTALDTLKLVKLLGFEIKRKPTEYCPKCGKYVDSEYGYCPHCGAKMDR